MKINEVMEYIGCSRNTVMRYKKQGILTTKKDSKGKLVFDRKQVKKIVGQYEDNKDKFKAIGTLEEIQNPAPPTPPKEVMATYEEKGDNPELLNDYGKQELMRVTQRLRDMELIDMVDAGVINRYAIALQMQHKYLVDMKNDEGNMIYMKLYEMFTRQVTNYEKELGLTAAAASKLNIKEKAPVDEMESFLNNG